MTVSKPAADAVKTLRTARKEPAEGGSESPALQMGELSELLGYSLKRAQLKIFEDFLRCVAPLQLTPAQFSVLLLLDKNPGRNQTEIANTLGILRPNFVAMLDGLESRDLCARMRSTNDRRSHILMLTDKGRAVLARAKKLVAAKHEARLNELLGPANRAALLGMLAKIAAGVLRCVIPGHRDRSGRDDAAGTPFAARAPPRNSRSISRAGSGRLNRKPCISVQPSDVILSSCSLVSTPSAVAVMPMPLASAATARTMLSEPEFSVMSLTKERSILILSNGKHCR